MTALLANLLTGWSLSADWLTNELTHWVTDKLSNWLTCQLTDWLAYWLAEGLSDGLTELRTCWLANWLISWLADWLADLLTDLQTYLLINLLTNWLAELLNYWLTDWLTVTDWLIDWLAHWLIGFTGLFTYWRFMLRKENNFNALHDTNQNYWDCWWKWLIFHFRSNVSSRCDKTSTATGFRGYLQCHRCCIYCFVIQLMSEPDKLNCWYSLFKVRVRWIDTIPE